MHYLYITFDDDPKSILLWRHWDVAKATIKGSTLTLHWKDGDMVIKADDPKMVSEMIFSHTTQPEVKKGKLGIKSVTFTKKSKKKKKKQSGK